MKIDAEQPQLFLPEFERSVPVAVRGLAEILEQHADWLDSGGEAGIQANLSRKNLDGADLIDARLQDAILNKTNLKRADLMLADLRGASLLQANLQEANLLGTQFQQANLQAANLKNATGLVDTQFAGANLFGTVLPETTSPLEGLKNIGQAAGRTGWLLAALLALHALVWLRIFTTRDAQLLNNSPALPYFGLQADFPFVPFYLFGPVLMLGLYVSFHLYMQRLWDGTSQLPAIFPDGRTLDDCLPWFARWAARAYSSWLRSMRSPLAFLEAGIAMVLLYWVTPATLLLFWARYLTLEDLRGSAAQALLVAGAVVAALNFPRMAAKSFGADLERPGVKVKFSRKKIARLRRGIPIGVGLVLCLLSAGIILGVPHDAARTVPSGSAKIKAWAAQALWLAGYNPFAQLTEADVSTKPPGWSGREEDLAAVKGASLNRLKLRYIQAYGAFFAKAHLWQADLGHAYLSEADLREANLRQANLQFAALSGAKLDNATMQESNLQNAVLDRAGLRAANLSSAILSSATLLDAILDGANLYKADLRAASLQRASLKQADLREAILDHANLASANLQEAYLTSTKLGNANLKNADLGRAILDDADLRNSDLSAAKLQGTVLTGADLTGASLQGADLRGAVGLTWKQICSSAGYAQAQIDDSLQFDLQTLCVNHR
ncbi:MAG: pentapeptide repeat-containing protein [Acidobacteriia bacterium]|nr:pentapeptide repeat-containing protein [Terriglobia bacterium]